MKITNIKSGKSYQLNPDTKLKITRTNPFFNEYGEQSLPVSLPDTPYNQSLLDNPGAIANKRKPGSMIQVSIADGEYFMLSRQAILGVSPGNEISTSFYMNEGSFYSRIENTNITDVFGDETVPGIDTVDKAISYLKQLNTSGGDDMFSIFQVYLDPDDNGKGRYLNGNNGVRSSFYGEEATTETLNGKNITVPRGFYMTPFLKTNYVLKRLFAYFGYTLVDNFFTQTAAFRNMVFINNIADAIATGTIHIGQLIPKVSCGKILELFRRKFCCEFITDEIKHTATIILFNEVVDEKSNINLSDALVGKLRIQFPEKYKQLILESEDSIDSKTDTFDSLALIPSKYPTAQFNEKTGCFYRSGYQIFTRLSNRLIGATEIIADCGQRYYEGGNLETVAIKVPEAIPISGMFIGSVQFLNSSMKANSSNAEVEDTEKLTDGSDNKEMYLMLAFSHKEPAWIFTEGTVTNYIYRSLSNRKIIEFKISDYALVYNGSYGIFENFYRKLDSLYRNSMHTVRADLLLTQSQKLSISSFRKIGILGSEFFLNSFNYYLGGKNESTESELFTTLFYEPISRAKSLSEILPSHSTGYVWQVNSSYVTITESEYNASPFKDAVIVPFFPPFPTADMVGKRMYECKTALHERDYTLYTFWLEAKPEV